MANSETNCKLHINDNVILRDEELFFKKLGIGLFNRELVARFRQQIPAVSEERTVWLPRETNEVMAAINQGYSTLVRGALGSGKSAILYGLRARYRDSGLPYCYVDGHFVDTPPQVVERKLDWSVRNRALVSWDSMDYLVGKTRKVRKNPLTRHRERSLIVLNLLNQYLDGGHKLVGTSHCEPWISRNCDPENYQGLWEGILSRVTIHKVRGVFETPEEVIHFYQYAGLDLNQATYLAYLPSAVPQDIQSYSVEDMERYLKEYRICKLIALDSRPDSLAIRSSLAKMIDGDLPEPIFLKNLGEYIGNKNQETRVKMGFC